MRSVVQRVSHANVTVGHEVTGSIAQGLLVLLGVDANDTQDDAAWMARKVAGLRVFNDAHGRMNLSLDEVDGEVLAISQFTLLGDCRRGRRPSFVSAARPDKALELYHSFVAELRGAGIRVETGRFQQYMEVELTNEGPVTMLLDSLHVF